ncbi:MAG: right-handed parallel beta-helix repeat-containing protein [Phycisphaerales bacterium]|nr:right-handed parallel beta-helix repeat-containing protein [Phycisphaerales bacterium]|tara:strand:+ start:3307 stop:4383 length:1077 start_codon:yes stop_codon:yes gene_type:complete
MSTSLIRSISLLLLVLSPATLLAQQVRVPEQWPTIQEAVDQASPGDVISVGPGIWNQAIDLKGKPITLTGREGATKTILDGHDLGRSIIRCATQEKASTIIEGFTIINGTGDQELYGKKSAVGGGIVILGASPIIRNCVFKKNTVNYEGGAVYMARDSSPVFDSCIFLENGAEKGGAVFGVQSKPTFQRCVFENNEGRYSGGAIYNSDAQVSSFDDCHFVRNRASYYGGGIYEYGSSGKLKNCTFDRNRATYKGGAVCNGYRGKSELVDCRFLSNYDDVAGGNAPHMTVIAPEGACILTDGSCLNVTRQSCDDAAGVYRGNGIDCSSQPKTRMARSNDLNRDGRIDDRDALMLLLLWR